MPKTNTPAIDVTRVKVSAEGLPVATLSGKQREATIWCVTCYTDFKAVVAADAKRYGHKCSVCGNPSGLEV